MPRNRPDSRSPTDGGRLGSLRLPARLGARLARRDRQPLAQPDQLDPADSGDFEP
ncbi:hypothetical protein ACH492_36870 [Streptomyces sp. NPDC019443]|uniref:hypothetical protein n=1 Tax=Streptomyces sp. NPDC019443 TaxID=3365061 RepID=UPI0037BBB79F